MKDEDFKVTGPMTQESVGYKVQWCGMIAGHCRTAKQAFALARKKNKKCDSDDKYVAVRITTTTKTEFLKEEDGEIQEI